MREAVQEARGTVLGAPDAARDGLGPRTDCVSQAPPPRLAPPPPPHPGLRGAALLGSARLGARPTSQRPRAARACPVRAQRPRP